MVRVRVRGGYSNAPPAPPLRLQHGYHLSSDAVGVKYLHTDPPPAPLPTAALRTVFVQRQRREQIHTRLLAHTTAAHHCCLSPTAAPCHTPPRPRLSCDSSSNTNCCRRGFHWFHAFHAFHWFHAHRLPYTAIRHHTRLLSLVGELRKYLTTAAMTQHQRSDGAAVRVVYLHTGPRSVWRHAILPSFVSNALRVRSSEIRRDTDFRVNKRQ